MGREGMAFGTKQAILLTLVTLLAATCAAQEGNSRKLLQAATPCNPSSNLPNTCYNADGSRFICCPGACFNTPGATPSCAGGSSNPPPPTSAPSNPPPTSAPTNPPPTSAPVTPSPTTSAGPPVFNTGTNVNCYTDYPATPNACYGSDGSKFTCCPGTCGSSNLVPTCPGFVPSTPAPISPTPNPTSTSAATSTPTPTPTPKPTSPVTSTPTPTSSATATPSTPTPTPTKTSTPTPNPTTSPTPPPTQTANPTPTPTKTSTPTPNPTTSPTPPPTQTANPTPNPTTNATPIPTLPTYAECASDFVECGNPPPTGFVADNFSPSSAGRTPVSPPADPPFKTPPSRPALSGGGQSGTGPASPNTPQTSSGGGTVAGKTVTNNYFYLPSPAATSAGGSAATCTVIGTSNSPAVTSVGVTDDEVFFRTLEHTSECGDGAQWKIRIGKGGQIYYLTSTSNGFRGNNLVGPAQVSAAAFVDRVIQSVAYSEQLVNVLCGTKQGPCDWNIHQAGGYGPTYPALLGNQVSPGGDGVALISWGRTEQQGVDYSGDKRFRSNLFLQTWIRDVGQGSFELTWIWTNTGSIDVDFIDLPWEGLAFCPDLTHYSLSVPTSRISPDPGCPGCKFYNHANCGSPYQTGQCWQYVYPGEGTSDSGLFDCEKQTNGWMAFTSANCETARALGVIFAPKSPFEGGEPNFKCEIRFGRYSDPNSVYGNILETIKRPLGIPAGGGTLEFRYYMTAGATLAGVATQAGRLQPFVKETTVTYGAGSASVGLIKAQTKVPPSLTFQNLDWYALDKCPGKGVPLIIARHKATGVTVVTSSPYVFSCCTPAGPGAQTCSLTTCVNPDSTTAFLGFIGWGVGVDVVTHSPPAGLTNAVLLSSILPAAQFFDPQHPDTDIQKDIYVVSA